MLLKHLPLFFFSKGFSSQLSSVSLSVPVVYVAVSQQPSLPASSCSPLLARLSLLASQFVPIPPVVYVAVSQQPSLLASLYLPLFARPSLLASPCSPSGLSLSSLISSVVYVAVSRQPSLLASPCSPSGLSLSSLIPSVVYVAVSQQPSLLAPLCSPLFLLSCMLLYYSNPLVARVMASAFSRCLSSTKKNFVV